MNTKVEKFEDLLVWKQGMEIVRYIYAQTKTFKDFGLKDQMRRAAVSIPSNIAEGFEKRYQKEFIRYLNIARGSTAELRTQIQIAIDVHFIEKEEGLILIEKTKFISAMLYKLIQYRKRNDRKR